MTHRRKILVDTKIPDRIVYGDINTEVLLQPGDEGVEAEITEGRQKFVQNFAEILYILRPLIYLGALKRYGVKSWKAWAISLMLDLTSVLLQRANRWNDKESRELSSRIRVLAYYVLKSPAFDFLTQTKLAQTLYSTFSGIPILGAFCEMFASYVQVYQKFFFFSTQ